MNSQVYTLYLLLIFQTFFIQNAENQEVHTVRRYYTSLEIDELISKAWRIDFNDYKQVLPDMRISAAIKVAAATSEATHENNRKFTEAAAKKIYIGNCSRVIPPQVSKAYSDAHAGIKECLLNFMGSIRNSITTLLMLGDINLLMIERTHEYNEKVQNPNEKKIGFYSKVSLIENEQCDKISAFLQVQGQTFRETLTPCFQDVQNFLEWKLTLIKNSVDKCIRDAN